jgi:hypothetical protein
MRSLSHTDLAKWYSRKMSFSGEPAKDPDRLALFLKFWNKKPSREFIP